MPVYLLFVPLMGLVWSSCCYATLPSITYCQVITGLPRGAEPLTRASGLNLVNNGVPALTYMRDRQAARGREEESGGLRPLAWNGNVDED